MVDEEIETKAGAAPSPSDIADRLGRQGVRSPRTPRSPRTTELFRGPVLLGRREEEFFPPVEKPDSAE